MRTRSTILVDAGGLRAEAAVVDVLARVALALHRCGCELRLRDPSPELLDLIELAGLTGALGTEDLTPDSTDPRC